MSTHKPDTKYVWIYDCHTKRLRRMRTDDPRLKWDYPYAPQGKVQVYRTRVCTTNWSYFNYGTTPQEACDNKNEYTLREIARLESEIARLESEIARLRRGLVKP